MYNIPEELASSIPGYIGRRDQDIALLKEYVIVRDYEAIKNLGHKLKGNGSSYGFDRLSELGILLENAANDKDIEQVLRLLTSLQSEVTQIKSEVLSQ